jgi:phenylacetic acid degradation operon negative regulatory protein
MDTMNAKIAAEELLILMAYGVDMMMFPTFRNWDQSYEGWLYKNGLLGRVHYLEAQKFLARERKGTEWMFKITEAGQLRACGGRDPERRWQRPWDGSWRQLVFDLPMREHMHRPKLIRWLRRNGFGYLQDSVWITPDSVDDLSETLKSFRDDAEAFTILECHCAPGFANSALVKGAWPFSLINESYRAYKQFSSEATKTLRKGKLHPRDLFILLRSERAHWAKAFVLDPLLPLPLWPADYEGRRAWEMRKELLRIAATHAKP